MCKFDASGLTWVALSGHEVRKGRISDLRIEIEILIWTRFGRCEIGKTFFAVDVETKSIVTFEELIEVIHPLKGIFQI